MAEKPKTAYDVRRYVTLIQVLATDDYLEKCSELAKAWGINLTSSDYLREDHMIHTLAKHVVEYHRAKETGIRFVVEYAGQADDSPTGEAWSIKDTVTGHGVTVDNRLWYYTKEEAQKIADYLNEIDRL